MKQYIADLPVTVNLNVVAKYNEATKLKVNHLIAKAIPVDKYQDILKVFVIKEDEMEKLHPAFNYSEYATEVGLNETNSEALLYLIYANCLYEWKVYSTSLITTEVSNDTSLPVEFDEVEELNLTLLARESLLTIKELCQFIESNLKDINVKFNYNSAAEDQKKGSKARATYKAGSTVIKETILVESILRHTIDKLFLSAKESNNPILAQTISDIESPTYNSLTNILLTLHAPPKKLVAAISIFRKYLINTILDFLSEELNIEMNKQSISKPVAMIIYSIFALLHLIDPELINIHRNNASRIRYIRSMAHNTGNLTNQKPEDESSKELNFFESISFESI